MNICSENVLQLILDGKKQAEASQPGKFGWDLINVLDADSVKDIYDVVLSSTKEKKNLARLERNDASQETEQREDIWTWFANEIERLDKSADGPAYQVIPGQDGSVFCWAFGTESWELKPPCLRCQRIYSGWTKHGQPSLNRHSPDTEAMRHALRDMYTDGVKYNLKKNACTYCAETVAASKLSLLRTGTLTLS